MRYGITILLLCIALGLFAQDEQYKLFYYNGDNYYKQTGQNSWQKIIVPGFVIFLNDSISISENGSIHLIGNSGQLFFDVPGRYDLRTIISKSNEPEGGYLLVEYVDFIVDEMSKPRKNIENYGDEYLHAKGGVTRANSLPVPYSPFSGCLITGSMITFNWENTGADYYTLMVWDNDLNGNVIFSSKVSDTVIQIPTTELQEGKTLYWSVTEKNKPATAKIPFTITTDKLKNALVEKTRSMLSNLNESRVNDLIMLASFYEGLQLYMEANLSYLRAIEIEPENTLTKEYYKFFVARM